MRKNIVITGLPRSGKSTLLKNVIQGYENRVGFVTNELREAGERVGFEIETHAEEKTVLAHIDFDTGLKVSRYGVNPGHLDSIIPGVEIFKIDSILYLDEIGQMELLSGKFKQLVLRYLNASNTCLVTLSKVYRDTFTEQIGHRSDIIFVEIDEQTREIQEQYVKALLVKIIKAKRYLSEPNRFSRKENTIFLKSDHDTQQLTKLHNEWTCRCSFFRDHAVCSHVIATEEYEQSLG